MSEIQLLDSNPPPHMKITQLYKHLELFSQGEPSQHTLFVLGQEATFAEIETVAQLEQLGSPSTQLLLIDPPENAAELFRLEGEIAVLFTGPARDVDLPRLQTQAGGVAHLRVGEHFLDVYSQPDGNIVHLPALGIILGGAYGSDATLPEIAPGSDGAAELDALRLLASLVKGRRLQLYIPRVGTLTSDRVDAMQRLAADVAYLHGLRRVIPAIAQRGSDLREVQAVAESLLPSERRTSENQGIHRQNVQRLYAASA
jgi:hypothetical protein